MTGGPGLYVLAYARADLLDFASECSDAASASKTSARAASRSRLWTVQQTLREEKV